MAAGPAIGRRAQQKLTERIRRDSLLWEFAKGDPNIVTSELVGQADAAGDSLAHEVLLETVVLLSVWLSNIVDLLEPDVIIIGGGVAAMLQPFFADMHAQISDICVNSRGHEIPLLPACYGTDSGIAGGTALCAQPKSPGVPTKAPFVVSI